MIKKRNGFLTFCFSMVPGAGHMYNGFMKRGVSLMILFFVSFALGGAFAISIFTWTAPIVWFYAFFDCINLRFQDNEEFYMQEDNYVFDPEWMHRFWISDSRSKFWIGVGLIALGCYSLLRNILLPTLASWGILPLEIQNAIYAFIRALPRFASAGIVILVGVLLIRGKKRDLFPDDEPGNVGQNNAEGGEQE